LKREGGRGKWEEGSGKREVGREGKPGKIPVVDEPPCGSRVFETNVRFSH